jgi:stress response protein SCP2
MVLMIKSNAELLFSSTTNVEESLQVVDDNRGGEGKRRQRSAM